MVCYRIAHERYATDLVASGRANRWNRENQFVLYTSSSRSLAMLEMLVHRGGIYPSAAYKFMVIKIVGDFTVHEQTPEHLPEDWQAMSGYSALQALGTDWYTASNDLIMEIPSVIVPQESNFILNTFQGDFSTCVHLQALETLSWDERLF